MRRKPNTFRTHLKAVFVLWLAYKHAVNGLWHDGDPVLETTARVLDVDFQSSALTETCRLLLARRLLFPSHRRPHYSGELKLAIVLYGEMNRLRPARVAREFGIARSTIGRWLNEYRSAAMGVTRLGQQSTPLAPNRRIADAVRELACFMAFAGFTSNGSIKRALVRVGIEVSERSIGRFLDEDAFPRLRSLALAFLPPPTAPTPDCAAPSFHDSSETPRLPKLALPKRLGNAFEDAREILHVHLGSTHGRRFRTQVEDSRRQSFEDAVTQHTSCKERFRILHQHLARVPTAKRPRNTPALRADALRLKNRLRWSNDDAARRLVFAAGTISRWNVAVDGVSGLVVPTPMPRSDETAIAEAAGSVKGMRRKRRRHLETALRSATDRIRVRHALQRGRVRIHVPGKARDVAPRVTHPIVPDGPNHFWNGDNSRLKPISPDDPELYLSAILDNYSRRCLVFALYLQQPSDEDLARLFNAAVALYGKPKHFVSDRGGQFTGDAFQKALEDLGVDHRIGRVGEHGSIAITERFWLTVKTLLDEDGRPSLIPGVLAERIGLVIHWYNELRPHSSLGCATPAEVFAGTPSAAHGAKPAPRGRRGEVVEPLRIVVRFVTRGGQRLPYLERLLPA